MLLSPPPPPPQNMVELVLIYLEVLGLICLGTSILKKGVGFIFKGGSEHARAFPILEG